MQPKTKYFILPALLLTILLALCFTSAVSASADDDATYLYEIGLFKGTDNGFELEKQATRIEALVMLIRLLGLEQEALTSTFSHPFTDVPAWAVKYVAFSYKKGFTSGIDDSTFGSELTISDQQYFTFVLRALAYDDKKGDFTWNQARQKAVELGIVDNHMMENWEEQLTRGNVASISRSALSAQLKGGTQTLLEQLVSAGAVDKNDIPFTYEKAGDRVITAIGEETSTTPHSLITSVLAEAFPEAVYVFTHTSSTSRIDVSHSALTEEILYQNGVTDLARNTIVNNPFVVLIPNDSLVMMLLDSERKLVAYAYTDDIDLAANRITWRTEIPDEYDLWQKRWDTSLRKAMHIPSEAYKPTQQDCRFNPCIQFISPSQSDYPILEQVAYFYETASTTPFEEYPLAEIFLGFIQFQLLNSHYFVPDSPVLGIVYNPQRGIYHFSFAEPYRMVYYMDKDLNIIAYSYFHLTE